MTSHTHGPFRDSLNPNKLPVDMPIKQVPTGEGQRRAIYYRSTAESHYVKLSETQHQPAGYNLNYDYWHPAGEVEEIKNPDEIVVVIQLP